MTNNIAPIANLTTTERDQVTVAQREDGKLSNNIMHFARVLRDAGLPVGPGKILTALEAVQTVGLSSRADLYWTLHAVFVNRRDQREVFDQAFHVFWRNPDLLKRMMRMMLPTLKTDADDKADKVSQRVAEAVARNRLSDDDAMPEPAEEDRIELDAALTHSQREILAEKDFESMSSEEFSLAKKAIARLRLAFRPVPTRRFGPNSRGQRADLRATLREAAKRPDGVWAIRRRRRCRRVPPVVVLCDISGSMDRYARMMLHFLHALTTDRDRVHSFLFGTRLTNVTRLLRQKDPDVAVDKAAAAVLDWAGGTRIGDCLATFNRDWSRRVLSQNPIVLLITDGLDRDTGPGLAAEMDRLHRSCRRLIWLNPLLRFDGYEPRATGARAIINHVDTFKPVHNLLSLSQLADALLDATSRADMAEIAEWRKKAA